MTIDELYLEHRDDIKTLIHSINEEIEYLDPDLIEDNAEQRYYLTLDDMQRRLFSFMYAAIPSFDTVLVASTLYTALFRYNMAKSSYGNIYTLKLAKKDYTKALLFDTSTIKPELFNKVEELEDTLLHIKFEESELLLDFHFIELINEDTDEIQKFLQCSTIHIGKENIQSYNFHTCITDIHEFTYFMNALSVPFTPDTKELYRVMKVSILALLKVAHNKDRKSVK